MDSVIWCKVGWRVKGFLFLKMKQLLWPSQIDFSTHLQRSSRSTIIWTYNHLHHLVVVLVNLTTRAQDKYTSHLNSNLKDQVHPCSKPLNNLHLLEMLKINSRVVKTSQWNLSMNKLMLLNLRQFKNNSEAVKKWLNLTIWKMLKIKSTLKIKIWLSKNELLIK